MRVTVSSLRLFFYFIGALSSFGSLIALLNSGNVIDLLLNFFRLCFSVGLLYIGFTLRQMLVKSPEIIQIAINIQIIIVSASFGISLLSRPSIPYVMGAMAGMGLMHLLCFYCLSNVKRLSTELRQLKQN